MTGCIGGGGGGVTVVAAADTVANQEATNDDDDDDCSSPSLAQGDEWVCRHNQEEDENVKPAKEEQEDVNNNNILQSWFQNVTELIHKEGGILQFLRDKALVVEDHPTTTTTTTTTTGISSQQREKDDDENAQYGGKERRTAKEDDNITRLPKRQRSRRGAKDPFSHLWETKQDRRDQQHAAEVEAGSHAKEDGHFLKGLVSILTSDNPSDAFLKLVLARSSSSSSDNDEDLPANEDQKQTWIQLIREFQGHLQQFKEQFQRAFPDIEIVPSHQSLAAYYFLQHEETTKNPVWKRQQHKFLPRMTDLQSIQEFHNALYLSELAYSATVDDIRLGLEKFQNDSWALLYATVESNPHQPAHFLANRKHTEEDDDDADNTADDSSSSSRGCRGGGGGSEGIKAGVESILPWAFPINQRVHTKDDNNKRQLFGSNKRRRRPRQRRRKCNKQRNTPKDDSNNDEQETYLEVALVVRGTKEIGDVISDIMFETVDYRNGHRAHGGVLEAGKFIVRSHLERLKQLLELSNKTILRVWCIGHSLGGGAASIAAIELNDYDLIEASAIGFGSPSLLSAELSKSQQDIITTIISDSDLVPRLSAPSMVKLYFNIMCHAFGESAKRDVHDFMNHIRTRLSPSSPRSTNDRSSGGSGGATAAAAASASTALVDYLLEQFDKVGRKFDQHIEENVIAKNRAIYDRYLQGQRDRAINNNKHNDGDDDDDDEIVGVHHVVDDEDYLEPPGTCLHLYRDGAGYTASYTPCSFFTEIDFVPSMIDDHLIPPGYHRALVTLARDLLQDLDFQFEHQKLPPTK